MVEPTPIREDQEPYNDGYTHEALHTTLVLMETFERHVMDTRCAEQFPDVAAAAEKAHHALFDLYQLIGSKFDDTTGKPSKD
ncbi:hypothetical protein [Bradyrhizobium neotropicale]|uniref:hypothetical protein n=1 Tax=Bradyrhizobium neotropicale TaxID=1497615 RepID=UPI001AD683AE|nr:hypothetical protein [Bradyrhizobium neotropicale]MBO4226662.1 hypothetical protein [Bradyrhizobium neotropicale]